MVGTFSKEVRDGEKREKKTLGRERSLCKWAKGGIKTKRKKKKTWGKDFWGVDERKNFRSGGEKSSIPHIEKGGTLNKTRKGGGGGKCQKGKKGDWAMEEKRHSQVDKREVGLGKGRKLLFGGEGWCGNADGVFGRKKKKEET